MVRLLTPAILAAAAIVLFPFAAYADQAKSAEKADAKPQPKISVVQKDNTQVLAAQATSVPAGMIPVVDDNGRLFFNKVVSPDELPKVDLDLDVVDTYTFEHNGRVYMNKVVANKA